MEKVKLSILKAEDLKQIEKWEQDFNGAPGLDAIYWYILGGLSFNHLICMLKTYNNNYKYNGEEYAISLIAKINNNIVGALIINMFDLNTNNPSLYIRDIFVHPKLQNQGIGKEILETLFSNLHDYFPETPKTIYANIDSTNISSQSLFGYFGFNNTSSDDDSLCRFETEYQKILEKLSIKEKLS